MILDRQPDGMLLSPFGSFRLRQSSCNEYKQKTAECKSRIEIHHPAGRICWNNASLHVVWWTIVYQIVSPWAHSPVMPWLSVRSQDPFPRTKNKDYKVQTANALEYNMIREETKQRGRLNSDSDELWWVMKRLRLLAFSAVSTPSTRNTTTLLLVYSSHNS